MCVCYGLVKAKFKREIEKKLTKTYAKRKVISININSFDPSRFNWKLNSKSKILCSFKIKNMYSLVCGMMISGKVRNTSPVFLYLLISCSLILRNIASMQSPKDLHVNPSLIILFQSFCPVCIFAFSQIVANFWINFDGI